MHLRIKYTYGVVGLVTAITTSVTGLAIRISGDNGSEGQNNQSDLCYTIIYFNKLKSNKE